MLNKLKKFFQPEQEEDDGVEVVDGKLLYHQGVQDTVLNQGVQDAAVNRTIDTAVLGKKEERAESDTDKQRMPERQKDGKNGTEIANLPSIDLFWNHLEGSGKSRRTLATYRYSYKMWRATKEPLPSVYALQVGDIERIIKAMHNSTARKHVAMLAKLAKFYLREGFPALHIETQKLELPPKSRRLPKDRGQEAFQSLKAQAMEYCNQKNRLGVWIGLFLMGGLRASEVQQVTIESKKLIKVVGKGKKERLVPLPEWVVHGMTKIPERQRGSGWKMCRKTIWKEFRNNNLGALHNLRHTYASELLRRGSPITDIKVLLGHENIQTTNIYTKLDVDFNCIELLER